MSDCIFCKIIKNEIPCKKVFENDDVIAFNDIHPQSPTHVLVVPKKHIPTINDIDDANQNVVGSMFAAARDITKQLGISEKGYRCIINCNSWGGQTVYHLHLHILGGKQMKEGLV